MPQKLKNVKKFLKAKYTRWIGKIQAKFRTPLKMIKRNFNKYFLKIKNIAGKFLNVLSSASQAAVSGKVK